MESRTKCTKHIKLTYRTDCFQYSFLARTTDEWNNLPNEIAASSEIKRVEAALRDMSG